jgi:hypothetical protein
MQMPQINKLLSFKAFYPSSPDKSEILNYCHAELVEATFFKEYEEVKRS